MFQYPKYHKLSQRAVAPYQERQDDIGWDVTLISRTENRVEDEVGHVNYFSTGLQLEPPKGYYFEMFARSSLHKSGYMLATGTSIIDPGYRGELLVPLFKFKDGDDLELPMRSIQLILKKKITCMYHESKTPLGTDSTRGGGGFGSTGQEVPQNTNVPQQEHTGTSYYM